MTGLNAYFRIHRNITNACIETFRKTLEIAKP